MRPTLLVTVFLIDFMRKAAVGHSIWLLKVESIIIKLAA